MSNPLEETGTGTNVAVRQEAGEVATVDGRTEQIIAELSQRVIGGVVEQIQKGGLPALSEGGKAVVVAVEEGAQVVEKGFGATVDRGVSVVREVLDKTIAATPVAVKGAAVMTVRSRASRVLEKAHPLDPTGGIRAKLSMLFDKWALDRSREIFDDAVGTITGKAA